MLQRFTWYFVYADIIDYTIFDSVIKLYCKSDRRGVSWNNKPRSESDRFFDIKFWNSDLTNEKIRSLKKNYIDHLLSLIFYEMKRSYNVCNGCILSSYYKRNHKKSRYANKVLGLFGSFVSILIMWFLKNDYLLELCSCLTSAVNIPLSLPSIT